MTQDDWKTRVDKEFHFRDGLMPGCYKIYSPDIERLKQFIESEITRAKEEERERIWKKGRKLINDDFLDRLIRQTKEKNPIVKKAFVNAVVEGLIIVMTDPDSLK